MTSLTRLLLCIMRITREQRSSPRSSLPSAGRPRSASAALALLTLCAVAQAESLTYSNICSRLYDLEQLALLPANGERTTLFSSHSRRSRVDATGKHLEWSNNQDADGVIETTPDGELVLARMTGPGCIWRVWSAAPGNGRIRFQFDDSSQPAIDLPFVQLFDNTHTPFDFTNLNVCLAGGRNLLVPMPFNRSCRVTAEKGFASFYQIVCSSFAPGTSVETFALPLTPPNRATLASTDSRLAAPALELQPARSQTAHLSRQLVLAPHTTVTAFSLTNGPAAISELRTHGPFQAGDTDADTLRRLEIRIAWDQETTPSVRAPLGDFFGSAPGIQPYQSLPMSLTAQDFRSSWFMPFTRSAEIALNNTGSRTVTLDVQVAVAPLSRPPERYARFHAKFHRGPFPPAEPARAAIDWPLLKTDGRGRFVGIGLHVFNPDGRWWGEGDEKFYVDGETAPSWFGTGSEDYFGYAWCSTQLFSHAFQNQSRCDGNHTFHTHNSRWHIADSVPFETRFYATLEKYLSDLRPTRYAATVYWYLAPDGVDPYTEPVAYPQLADYFGLLQPASLDQAQAVFDAGQELVTEADARMYEQDPSVLQLTNGVPTGPFWRIPPLPSMPDFERAFFTLDRAGKFSNGWYVLRVLARSPDRRAAALQVSAEADTLRAWCNDRELAATPRLLPPAQWCHECYPLELQPGANTILVAGQMRDTKRIRILLHNGRGVAFGRPNPGPAMPNPLFRRTR